MVVDREEGEQRRQRRCGRGGGSWIARRRGGMGAPASATGKRCRRYREERGAARKGAARGGGGRISCRTAVGRGAA